MNTTDRYPLTLVDEWGQVHENLLNVRPEHLDITIKRYTREGAEVKITEDKRILVYKKRRG